MSAVRRPAAVAAGGGLLILIALAFDTAPLFVPGVAFLAVGLFAPALVWLPGRAAKVARLPGEHEVVEGARYRSTVLVSGGRLGLHGAEVHDPIAGKPFAVHMAPSWRGGRSLAFEVSARFARRGRTRLEPPELALADPLGLAHAIRRARDAHDLLVLPRIEPVRWRRPQAGRRRHALEYGSQADALAASEVDGLRPYRPGTPASRIHWPAVARGAGLLERRMRAEHDSLPLVVLDSRCAPGAEERLDEAVRAAASIALELGRRGGCTLLTDAGAPIEIDARLARWSAAHARLAVVERSQRPPALAARRRMGELFYVAADGSARPPRDARGILVLPAALRGPHGWAVALEVAGCVGYTISSGRAGPRPSNSASARTVRS